MNELHGSEMSGSLNDFGFSSEPTIAVGAQFDVNIFGHEWYRFRYNGHIELPKFPLQEQKDTFLKLSNIWKFSETNRNLVEDLRRKRHIQDLLKRAEGNAILTEVLMKVLETGGLQPVRRGDIASSVIYHGTGMVYKRKEMHVFPIFPTDNINTMQSTGIYGSAKRITYVTQDFERAITHAPRGVNSEILLLVFSTDKLLAVRSMFPDPESLSMNDEFMRNFVVPHGLPASAIVGAYHLTCLGEATPNSFYT
jgi:hypothetical protein